ncbi:MAG: hypothetical protein HYY50_03740 [Candidatus Kerfeldbacteria bacterium]|nr:hypothetical protein [Candidatus Kerfeldbacteria bacterium]
MAQDKVPNITRHTLCGVQGCCPTVEINHDSDEVTIADDFGGKVKLTKEQWREARTNPMLDA